MKRDYSTGSGNPARWCYFYLHVNGQLIHKPSSYNVESFEESDFVKCWWKIDLDSRLDAYRMLIRARTLGIDQTSFQHYISHWSISDMDSEEFIRRERLNFRRDDTGNWIVWGSDGQAGRGKMLFMALCNYYELLVQPG